MVINSNFDNATKQRMISEIQNKYKKASKEASRKKKISPAQKNLKEKTSKKYGEDPQEGKQGDKQKPKTRAEKAKTA